MVNNAQNRYSTLCSIAGVINKYENGNYGDDRDIAVAAALRDIRALGNRGE